MVKNKTTPLTIFIPCHEPWDRTADFLRQTALRLSQNHIVVLVLMYQGKFWLTTLWQNLFKTSVTQQEKSSSKNLVFSYPLWLIPGERFGFIRQLNQKLWLRWLWLQWSFKKPLQKIWLWLFSPEDWFFPKTIPGVQALYDCVDDHSQLDAATTTRLKQQEKILIQKADLFFTNSHVLAELHRSLRRPTALVVQGFDTALWPKKLQPTKTVPKTLLLMGSLDERVNWPLLIGVMKKLADHRLELAGPIALTVQAQSQKLLQLTNVRYHGSLPRKALHDLLTEAHLCLIPYNIDLPAAKHSFPMKVLEFFAYGKPVISTKIVELRHYSPYVTIATTQAEWITQIKQLTQKSWPTELQQKERQIAWSHRYETKLEQILAHMRSKV